MHSHVTFGFCWLDILAVVILLAVIVYAAVKLNKLKKQKEYLEGLSSGNAVNEQPEKAD